MTDTHQIQQDLQYVRQVVERAQGKPHRRAGIYWTWALYVLIGYPLLDFAPKYSTAFFNAGLVVAMIVTIYLSRRYRTSDGVKIPAGRATTFWLGGRCWWFFARSACRWRFRRCGDRRWGRWWW
jgi:hypothetical protein